MRYKLLTRNRAISAWSLDLLPGKGQCAAWDPGPRSTCRYCYAQQGRGPLPSVIAARRARTVFWDQHGFNTVAKQLVLEIGRKRFIRFFSSGDFRRLDDVRLVWQVARACPKTRFWISTRCWSLGKSWIEALCGLDSLPNVCVRLSAWDIDSGCEYLEDRLPRFARSRVATQGDGCPKQLHGSCGKGHCRRCWDSKVKCVTYRLHGYRLREGK